MALQFEIVVVAKEVVIPLRSLACSLDVVVDNLLGHLASDACRAHNESLVISLKVGTVGTRPTVESVNP